MAKIGYGRTREELLDTVKRILDAEGRETSFKDNRPTHGWYYCFMEHHPELSSKTPQPLSKQRAMITPDAIQKCMDGLKAYILEEVGDPSLLNDPSRWYNADETPFNMCPRTGKIISPKSWRNPYFFTGSDKKITTLMACFSGVGHFVPPFIVFPGKYMPRKDNPCEKFDEAVFTMAETGFMNQALFVQFLEFFDKEITLRKVKRPVILLVDGSSTHISYEASEYCHDRGICLYCFLANATHIQQPCDVALNSPLKTNYKSATKHHQVENPGELINKFNFPTVLKEAWYKTTSVSLAAKGFQECGLYPLDINGINKEKFAAAALFEFSKENEPGSQQSTSSVSSTTLLATITNNESSSQIEASLSTSTVESPITNEDCSTTNDSDPAPRVQPLSCITNIPNTSSHTVTSDPSNSALKAIEATLSAETLQKYNKRNAEGYDLEIDPLYNAWKILNGTSDLPIQDKDERMSAVDEQPTKEDECVTIAVEAEVASSNVDDKLTDGAKSSMNAIEKERADIPEVMETDQPSSKESAVDKILVLPKVNIAPKKRQRPVSSYAISGAQFREHLKEKRAEEERKAREKEDRKIALAKRKEEKAAEEERKAQEKEERKIALAKRKEEKAIEMEKKQEERERLRLEREEKKKTLEAEKEARHVERERKKAEKEAEKEAKKEAAQKRRQEQKERKSKQMKTQ